MKSLDKMATAWFNRWSREGLIIYKRVKFYPMLEAWKAGYRAGRRSLTNKKTEGEG